MPLVAIPSTFPASTRIIIITTRPNLHMQTCKRIPGISTAVLTMVLKARQVAMVSSSRLCYSCRENKSDCAVVTLWSRDGREGMGNTACRLSLMSRQRAKGSFGELQTENLRRRATFTRASRAALLTHTAFRSTH